MLLNLISNTIAICCIFLVLVAVLIDFGEFQERDQVRKKKKSIVETGTMFLFFLFFYYLIRFNIGRIYLSYQWLRVMMMIIGDLILIFGCWVNLKGRMVLGKNWSNQIKIYKDHYLVTNGVYQIVRHPLYASIVWMFFGASLIYVNYLSFLANIFIFVPFMYYRAKQEEGLLIKEFKDYKNYQLKVGSIGLNLSLCC
jgi:protein-S-isoprenylcysteine O-methyltransferase Ste14